MHADLKALGFRGSNKRKAAFEEHRWANPQHNEQTTERGTFIPLHFGPGSASQRDASAGVAVLGGECIKLQVAHFSLSHCRAPLFTAVPWPNRCSNLFS